MQVIVTVFATGLAEVLGDGEALALGDGEAEGLGVAEGAEDALGAGVTAGFGEALGVGVDVADTTEIVLFTGVVAIVTNLAIAIFLITAGVTGALLTAAALEFPFLFHIAVHTMLLVPTVTVTFSAFVTELQLQPPNE